MLMDSKDGSQNPFDDFPARATEESVGVAPVPVTGGAGFIPGGRTVSAERGLSWISGSWDLFKQKPGLWIGFEIALMAGIFILAFIPIVNIAVTFLMLLMIAGVVNSCDLLRREGSFAFGDLFAAFQRQAGPLLIVGLIAFGFMIVLMIIAFFFIGGAIIGAVVGAQSPSAVGAGISIGMVLIGGLIIFVGSILYAMAIWFTPALVFMHNIAPIEAIKMSFSACLKNILPGIVFFIVMTTLMIISMIPFGLGLLVTGPMFLICYYTSYRDVFIDEQRDNAIRSSWE
jgi:hypothetical protein